jgi:hypothetical protein
MLGLPVDGVRVTMRMPEKIKGLFAKIASTVSAQGWGIMGVGSFPSPRQEGYYDMVLKIAGVSSTDEAEKVLSEVEGHEIVDIRDVV